MAEIDGLSPDKLLSKIIDNAVRKAMVETQTHVPATVISFKRMPRPEVSVRVDMKVRLRSGDTMEVAQVDRVPVTWPAGGGWCMDADLVPGDQVLLEVFDRDIAGWLKTGEPADPATGQLHAITCCTALAVSIRSDAKVAKAMPGTGVFFLGREAGTPPWMRFYSLPVPKITLQAQQILLGEGATLGVVRQNDPALPLAGMIAWMTAVSAGLSGLGVPAAAAAQAAAQTNFASIPVASTIVKAL